MEQIIAKLLELSISASYLIAVIIILRLILRKAPRSVFCFMWALAGLRLAVPFSFESIFSLIPKTQSKTAIQSIATVQADRVITNSAIQPESIGIFEIGFYIWIAGFLVMLIYMLTSYLLLKRQVRESAKLRDNIWICDQLKSPFVVGIIRPRIYIPSAMNEKDIEYVLAHESSHLKRLDNIWKPLGFVLLSIYWFNPLCWIAYWLFTKDIELACDERVIKDYNISDKKAYSTTLLEYSIGGHIASACPLAFGGSDIKQRIKRIVSYKKPAVWVIVISITACVVTAVCFMTEPISAAENKEDVTQTAAEVATAIAPTTEAETTEAPATEPTTEPITEQATEPPTEEVTEPESSDEQYYEQNDYSESYDNYDDSYIDYGYSDDSYSDNSYTDDDYSDNNSNHLVEITPFEYKPDDYYYQISYSSSSNNTVAGSYNPMEEISEKYGNVLKWDINTP